MIYLLFVLLYLLIGVIISAVANTLETKGGRKDTMEISLGLIVLITFFWPLVLLFLFVVLIFSGAIGIFDLINKGTDWIYNEIKNPKENTNDL